jgi:hypothetical protein
MKRGDWNTPGAAIALVLFAGLAGVLRAQAPAAAGATAWTEQRRDIEAYLRTADVVKIDAIGVGVTSPRRAHTAPGGLVGSFTWKPITPGRYKGYWESYKSEIAAYELDKILGLGMVPPTVERRVKGEVGAAVMWVSPTRSFKDLGGVPGQDVKGPPPAQVPAWTRQLTRAKMFDNLIGNIDPNLGNWLVDPSWNLVIIDHTRAFTTTRELYHRRLAAVDTELWDKIKSLDEPGLTATLGAWVGKGEIKAILQRRDKMQQVIDKLLKTKS